AHPASLRIAIYDQPCLDFGQYLIFEVFRDALLQKIKAVPVNRSHVEFSESGYRPQPVANPLGNAILKGGGGPVREGKRNEVGRLNTFALLLHENLRNSLGNNLSLAGASTGNNLQIAVHMADRF